ncbi:MAG: hypothetical protein RXP97_06705 [Nitrososphaeria archaeon]
MTQACSTVRASTIGHGDRTADRRTERQRSSTSIAISWFLWGMGYYAYFAYLSPYMATFVEPSYISRVYVLVGLAAVAYPAAGLMTHRFIGARGSISLWMSIAGLGISLMGMARGFAQFVVLLSLNQAFYAAMPSYYASLAREEASYIPLVWALSVAPSFFMPTVGGFLASRLGYTALFAASGALIVSSFIPVAACSGLRAGEGVGTARGWIRAIPAMVPVALEAPYIFLIIERAYGLSSVELGLIASAGEAVGMLSALALRRRPWGIAAALAGFSLTALVAASWTCGVAFGFWEAVIPLAIAYVSSESPGVKFYAYLTTLQALTFLAGYVASAAVASVNYMAVPIVGGVLSALLAAIYATLMRGPRGSSRS